MGTYRCADGFVNIAGLKGLDGVPRCARPRRPARRPALRDRRGPQGQPRRVQRRVRGAPRHHDGRGGGRAAATRSTSRPDPSTRSTRSSPTRRCSTSTPTSADRVRRPRGRAAALPGDAHGDAGVDPVGSAAQWQRHPRGARRPRLRRRRDRRAGRVRGGRGRRRRAGLARLNAVASAVSLRLHWFLPTGGDSRDVLAVGPDAHRREPTLEYLSVLARTAEDLGFEAVLTPTGTWCEDSWVSTAALIRETTRLKFLVAFRPGSITPTLAAQMAATFQRHSGGRALLNVVTGGDAGRAAPLRRPPRSRRAVRAHRRVPRDRARRVERRAVRLRGRALSRAGRDHPHPARSSSPRSTSAARRARPRRSPPGGPTCT